MRIPFSPKIIILLFVIVLVSIPTVALLLKQRIDAQRQINQPYNGTVTQGHEVPKVSPILDNGSASSSANMASNQGGAQISYGPSLDFTISMQGRPANNQGGKVFVGISSGEPTTNPQYILSYTVDMPQSGTFSGLSLAGLSNGQTYTAYIKGPAQIAKAVSFALTPTGATLNSGNPIVLTTGDLNQDNRIDNADYTIEKSLLGTTPASSNWNPNADFNLDNVVNTWDLEILSSNLGKTGDGGPWYSRIDQTASNSAEISTPSNIGGPGGSSFSSPQNNALPPYQPTKNGYWLWVPSPD